MYTTSLFQTKANVSQNLKAVPNKLHMRIEYTQKEDLNSVISHLRQMSDTISSGEKQ